MRSFICLRRRPAAFSDFLDSVQLAALDFVAFPGVACMYPNPKFYETLKVYMLVPLVIIAVIIGTWRAAVVRGNHLGLEMHKIGRRLTDNVIHTVVFFLFFLYPMLSAKVCSAKEKRWP